MGVFLILYVCILLGRHKRDELFKESQKSLKNYIVSKTYLEYAQWLLRDIDNFISFASKPVIASRYGEVETRFKDIQAIIDKADEVNQDNSPALQEPFKLHYAHTISFYSYERYDFSRCFDEEDESLETDFALVDVLQSGLETNTAYKSYLPSDHYESYLCEAACIESQAFLDSYSAEATSLQPSLSNREGAASAMDILEQTYQIIDSNEYRVKEFDALCSSSQQLTIDHSAFNRFQKIQKLYIVSLYREAQIQLDLYMLIQEFAEQTTEEYPSEQADKAMLAIENFELKIVEVSACSVRTALALCEQTLKIANCFDEDLQVKMLRPATNFEELFHSLEYNYLTNLPVAVPTL